MSNPDDLSDLTESNGNERNTEKLLICNDFINESKKTMAKLQKWVNSARKYEFTILLLAQNHQIITIQISRNIHMYWLFCMSDANTINTIIKTLNVSNVPKEVITKCILMQLKNLVMSFLLM